MSTRDARGTRRRLLEVGQEEIYLHGFQGASLEQIGQTSANIELATRIKRKDQRIFLDGIYVYEKKRN